MPPKKKVLAKSPPDLNSEKYIKFQKVVTNHCRPAKYLKEVLLIRPLFFYNAAMQSPADHVTQLYAFINTLVFIQQTTHTSVYQPHTMACAECVLDLFALEMAFMSIQLYNFIQMKTTLRPGQEKNVVQIAALSATSQFTRDRNSIAMTMAFHDHKAGQYITCVTCRHTLLDFELVEKKYFESLRRLFPNFVCIPWQDLSFLREKATYMNVHAVNAYAFSGPIVSALAYGQFNFGGFDLNAEQRRDVTRALCLYPSVRSNPFDKMRLVMPATPAPPILGVNPLQPVEKPANPVRLVKDRPRPERV